MRTIVALLLATLALTGCGVRLDAPDPTPTSPTADEAIRQREALRAAELTAVVPAGDPLLESVADHAVAHLGALGGVWRAWPAGDGPTPTTDPTADVTVGPDGVLAWLRTTRPSLEEAVVEATDTDLVAVLGAIAVSRALDEDALAVAAGEEPPVDDLPADLATADPGGARALDAAAHTLEVLAARAAAAGEDADALARAAEARRVLAARLVADNGWEGTAADPREPFYDVVATTTAEVDGGLALALLAALGDAPDRAAVLDAAVGRAVAAARGGEDLGPLPGLRPVP